MIRGTVRDKAARLQLSFYGRHRRVKQIEVLVDTGYNGFLSLPAALIKALGLRRLSYGFGVLADGTETEFDIYEGKLLWNRSQIAVPVAETGLTPLIGMEMFDGFELCIQVRPAGHVRLRRLKSKR